MTYHRDTTNGATRPSLLSRREWLLSARAGGLVLVVAPAALMHPLRPPLMPGAIAQDTAPKPPVGSESARNTATNAQPPAAQPSAQDVIRRLLRGATPVDGKVIVQIPDVAENGNIVPFSVTADSPMTDADFVKSIHIICSGNAQPHIGSFHFTALSGQASVTSRLRLAKTQDLFVLVEHSAGQFVLVQRPVKVTIGGCGGS